MTDGFIDCIDELFDIDAAVSIEIDLIDDGIKFLTLATLFIGKQLIDLALTNFAIIILIEQAKSFSQLLTAEFGRNVPGKGHKLTILDFI